MIVALMLSLLLTNSAATAGESARPWERYEVLVQRNLFSRQRAGTSSSVPTMPRPPVRNDDDDDTPPVSGNPWVLAGTAILNSDRIAFVEDIRTGAVLRVREGDMVDAARVERIGIEGVAIRTGDALISVRIGMHLDGLPRSGAAATRATTSAPSAGPVTPVNPNEADIIARLRARRSQETSD